jgi:hypothetical protein
VTLLGTEVLDSRSAADGQTVWSAGAGLFLRRSEAHTAPVALTVAGGLFRGNAGDLSAGLGAGDGGGILVKGHPGARMVSVTVTDTDFVENYNDQGGGLYVGRYATGSVIRCRFLRNIGHSQAGGAAKGGFSPENTGETVIFATCEFTGNRAGVDRDGEVTGAFSRGGGLLVRHYPRAELYHCTFSDNRAAGSEWTMGDGLAHAAEGGAFDTDAKRCALYGCVFYGPGSGDYQVRANPDGFSAVDRCAFAPGAFFSAGVEPTGTVWLEDSPFVAPDDPRPAAGSPCIDAAGFWGYDRDLAGQPVPQGAAPDIGAYEFPVATGAGDAPAAPRAPRVFPNPFNPRTTIAFVLETEARVELAVFDVRGRRIATLRRGRLAAGEHRVIWHGRDDAGLAAAAGIYYARLAVAGGARTATMTLVR